MASTRGREDVGQDVVVDVVAGLPAFLLAVVLISASPGPAMALIVRRAALRGLRQTVPTVLGLEAGLYAWALLAAAGLASVVAASQAAYDVLRVVGAVVLVGLGTRAWLAAWRDKGADEAAEQGLPAPENTSPRSRRPGRRAFLEGALVQLANPKAAIFMFAFYPQFVPDGRPLLATTALLALVQVTVETCLYLALAAGVRRAGGWIRRPGVRRRFEAASGTVLVGLGVKVAATSR